MEDPSHFEEPVHGLGLLIPVESIDSPFKHLPAPLIRRPPLPHTVTPVASDPKGGSLSTPSDWLHTPFAL